MGYPGKKLTYFERDTFDINIEGRSRRNCYINNFYKNGNEFVIDIEDTDDVFRIPNMFKSYFLEVKCFTANGTEQEPAVYDGEMYDYTEFDGSDAQTIWEEQTVTSTEFVGNFEDYEYIKVTVTGSVTNPRFVVKYKHS